MLGLLLDGLWPFEESSISSDMKISFKLYMYTQVLDCLNAFQESYV